MSVDDGVIWINERIVQLHWELVTSKVVSNFSFLSSLIPGSHVSIFIRKKCGFAYILCQCCRKYILVDMINILPPRPESGYIPATVSMAILIIVFFFFQIHVDVGIKSVIVLFDLRTVLWIMWIYGLMRVMGSGHSHRWYTSVQVQLFRILNWVMSHLHYGFGIMGRNCLTYKLS